MEREASTRIPLRDLIYQRDKALELSNNLKYTHRTRELAAEEAEHLSNCIYFMLLTRNRRKFLQKRGITPLNNNFSWREEESKFRGNETWTGREE